MYTRPITIDEAAERVGLHRNSIYLAIRLGRLKASKLGGTWVIWPTALSEYIRNHPRPSVVAHVNLEKLNR